MINITVKNLGNSRFELIFDQNGSRQQMVITENRSWVEEIGGYISNITSDNPNFYDIWGDIEIRKYVGQRIKDFSTVSELQAA